MMIKWIHPKDTRMVQYSQIVKHNASINKRKEKTHMTISIDVGKTSDKVQHTFTIKIFSRRE